MCYGSLKRYFLYFVPSLVLVLFLTSCESFDLAENLNKIGMGKDGELPKWTISINEVVKYPRASSGEKEVPTFGGRTMWVRKHCELSSKSIMSVRAVPDRERPNYYNLRMKLNRHGSLVVMRISNDTSHAPWAFLIDGVYYRSIELNESPLEEDYSEVMIKGPFDQSVALFLDKYSRLNYNYLHPDN